MKRVIILAGAIFFLASCHGNRGTTADQINQAKQEVLDSINQINQAKQEVLDSINAVNNVRETRGMVNHSNASYGHRTSDGRYYGSSNGQRYPASSSPAPRRKKWNWSDPAKGAVIGGAAGAATGAIVDRKHRAAGAVLGGLIGAGAGTATGVIIDGGKKHRR
jgi:hypothetical protein